MAAEAARLNEAFNHWIVQRTPFVTVKAAMSLDGKIATATGQSKWITGVQARAHGMRLRQGADAILVGVKTVLADNPSLTWRGRGKKVRNQWSEGSSQKRLRRVILDAYGQTPLRSRVLSDEFTALTTVVVTKAVPSNRMAALSKRVQVWVAPGRSGRIDLHWLLTRLGEENVTSLLVEGGGEVNGSFLLERLAHRIVFFYAPKIIGGRDAIKAVGGRGFESLSDAIQLRDVEWRRLGPDLVLTARSG
jgi:diaminohydroxyphosphoribosylaminopyrimidine deaminase/5-amino-6-(5-phosphoribosylamino)uracil reductase